LPSSLGAAADENPPDRISRFHFRVGAHTGIPQGLRELGYVEGKTIVIEWRRHEGKVDRLPALATELVRLKVDVIVVTGVRDLRSAKEVTATIPIVMVVDSDPIGSGFVASLAEDPQMLAGCQMFQGHGHRHEQ
jgi:putative tryptophan/tyrosine transport system substrate-binding protein